MTLDGKIATCLGDSKWITNETSRHFVHLLRAKHDAILIADGTAKLDNPQLNVRIGKKISTKHEGAKAK